MCLLYRDSFIRLLLSLSSTDLFVDKVYERVLLILFILQEGNDQISFYLIKQEIE